MKIKFPSYSRVFLLFLPAIFSTLNAANANYEHRLAAGAGITHRENPSVTAFTLGAEYEYRFDPFLGSGVFANYIFSNPSIFLLGIPMVFVHPLAGDWFVSASPIMETSSGLDTAFGVRLGTRIPLPLGILIFTPTFSVDFIRGGRNYIFGLGIGI